MERKQNFIMLDQGYIHIYTGEGKGKTSAALGLAFRALGRGLKVYMAQFLKGEMSSGEHFSAQAFGDRLTIAPFGEPGFIMPGHISPEDRMKATTGLKQAREAMESLDYDLVILDEINVAVDLSLLTVQDVLDFLAAKPARVELVLTGRNAHPEIMAKADLVSEISPVKHYFQNGIKAREGIEF